MESRPIYSSFTDSELFFFNWAYNFAYVVIPLLIKAKRDETSKAERNLALEQQQMNMHQEKMVMLQGEGGYGVEFSESADQPPFSVQRV